MSQERDCLDGLRATLEQGRFSAAAYCDAEGKTYTLYDLRIRLWIQMAPSATQAIVRA